MTNEPSRSRTFWDMIASDPDDVQIVCGKIRELVLEIFPNLSESVHGGEKVRIALYSLGERVLCGIQPSKRKCLLYIHYVTEVDSTVFKLKGKGGNNRHIEFIDEKDIDVKAVRDLLILAHGRISRQIQDRSEP